MSFFKGLQLSYDGKSVSDFAVSLAEVKNIGKVEIEENDFANKCPMCITTSGEFLIRDSIDAIPMKFSNQYSNIHLVSKDEKNINVKYDYLGMGDSFSLTVMHSGDLNVIGILKAGKFRPVDVPVDVYSTAVRRTIEEIVMFMLMPLFIHISAEMIKYNVLISLGILLIYGGAFMIITYMFFNITTTKQVNQ